MPTLHPDIVAFRRIVIDLHWMARRYADGRQSYAPGLFNEHTREAIRLGVELNPTADGTVWARDGDGRACDHLTDVEAEMGPPPGKFRPVRDEAITLLRAIAEGRMPNPVDAAKQFVEELEKQK